MPVNGRNETRCPNFIPSSLGYALTKTLSLPGSKTAVKKDAVVRRAGSHVSYSL